MVEWIARQVEYLADSWWIVEEVDDHGQGERRIIYCGDDEALARRIARLPELEASADNLLKTADGVSICIGDTVWRCTGSKSYRYEIVAIGKDRLSAIVTDEMGCSVGCVLDPTDCYSTREAAEAAREETGS